jgi:hypothetical protein
MMMAALDHVDRIDLYVTEMLDREPRRRWPVAEWHGDIEPLGLEPDASSLGLGDCEGLDLSARHGRPNV